MGTLYLVATPIGNLEDISARALRILGEVRLIAAEDTRHTHKLLDHFHIHTPLTSYHEHNKLTRLADILQALKSGDVALVSDAGTPALNDPGYELVRAVLKAGFPVSPIPGPSAPLAALVVSGLPTDAFLYLGYLPRRSSQRRRLLETVASLPYTLIFLESPHRLLKALDDLLIVLEDRPLAVARELTKLYEEIWRGQLSQARLYFENKPLLGEFTLVVGGWQANAEHWSEEHLRQEILAALPTGETPSILAARLAALSNLPRRKIYQLILTLQSPGIHEL